MPVTETPHAATDIAAIEADATARLGELREARQRLSLGAFSDAGVAAELADVEDEIANAERTLEQAKLARVEQGRRDARARAEAERKRREEALDRARELQRELEAAYAEWDAAVQELGARTRHVLGLWDSQDGALERAGRRPATNRFQSRAIALNRAFRANVGGLPRAVLELDGLQLSAPEPLVKGGFRPVEPVQEVKSRKGE
jgi:hypothetical protein